MVYLDDDVMGDFGDVLLGVASRQIIKIMGSEYGILSELEKQEEGLSSEYAKAFEKHTTPASVAEMAILLINHYFAKGVIEQSYNGNKREFGDFLRVNDVELDLTVFFQEYAADIDDLHKENQRLNSKICDLERQLEEKPAP